MSTLQRHLYLLCQLSYLCIKGIALRLALNLPNYIRLYWLHTVTTSVVAFITVFFTQVRLITSYLFAYTRVMVRKHGTRTQISEFYLAYKMAVYLHYEDCFASPA